MACGNARLRSQSSSEATPLSNPSSTCAALSDTGLRNINSAGSRSRLGPGRRGLHRPLQAGIGFGGGVELRQELRVGRLADQEQRLIQQGIFGGAARCTEDEVGAGL